MLSESKVKLPLFLVVFAMDGDDFREVLGLDRWETEVEMVSEWEDGRGEKKKKV